MTFEEGMMFIRNAKNYVALFGREKFEQILTMFDVKDFSTFEYVPLEEYRIIDWYDRMGYPVLQNATGHYVEEYKPDGWHRTVFKECREYRVPDKHQLNETKLLRAILETNFPYLKGFQMDTYHLESVNTDVYIKCEDGSLYVPVVALINGEWQMIADRHEGYHKMYYHGEERRSYLEKALSVLENYTARRLKMCMEECA